VFKVVYINKSDRALITKNVMAFAIAEIAVEVFLYIYQYSTAYF
jgi:hypothetical protein